MPQRSDPPGRLEPEDGDDPWYLGYEAQVALESVCRIVGLLLGQLPAEDAVDALNNIAGLVDFVAVEFRQVLADAGVKPDAGA